MASSVRLPQRRTEGVVPLRAPHRQGVSGNELGVAPRRSGRRLPWGRCIVLATAIYGLWIGHLELRHYHRLALQAQALRVQEVQLREQRAQLRREVQYASTDQYVAQAAAQEFGLVKPGQVPLAPVTGGSTQAPKTAQG